MTSRSLLPAAVLAMMMVWLPLTARPAWAALNLEGQSGVFLNSLAYTLDPGRFEASNHHVNLDGLGSVTSFSLSTGLRDGVEVGMTRLTSTVSGVKDQTVFLAKWQFAKERKSSPAAALWIERRDLSGGENSTDFGISATKLTTLSKRPVVLDIGVRSTKALGLGLFGFGTDRKLKLEGSAAVFLTPEFAAGVEFKQQIEAETWKDIAFRYVASDNLNIDGGIADLGPGLGNQIALAATWSR